MVRVATGPWMKAANPVGEQRRIFETTGRMPARDTGFSADRLNLLQFQFQELQTAFRGWIAAQWRSLSAGAGSDLRSPVVGARRWPLSGRDRRAPTRR